MNQSVLSLKFGGTSVTTPERRQMVVGHVRRELDAGQRVALVISAMGRRGDPYATDTILDLIRDMGGAVDPRNYAFLMVTGEMISVAVMVQTLGLAGVPAVPLTGAMAGIETDDFYMSAEISSLHKETLQRHLAQGLVPVVCGGQGLARETETFSILGRGGSDTTGVLVGIMAGAGRADIYTDVAYILATDPRIVADAPKRPYVSYEAAYEMARFGARVVHPRAVRLGKEHGLPIRVRSTFSEELGTLIGAEDDTQPLVGVTLAPAVQIAPLPGEGIKNELRLALEQHLGVLVLDDESTGRLFLFSPAADTAAEVDRELARHGVSGLLWQSDLGAVSLVGRTDTIQEMAAAATRILRHQAIGIICHEIAPNRATFVVAASAAKTALAAIYSGLSAYL